MPPISWQTLPDSERPGSKLRVLDLAGGATLTVSETSADEWSWVVADADGWPSHLRHGFTSEDEAMASAVDDLGLKGA